MEQRNDLAAHLRLVGMAALWGASWPCGRVIAQSMPPLAASSLRFLLATLVLLPWLYRRGGLSDLKTWSARRWAGMAAAGATGVFGYAIFFMLGLQHVPAGKAALVVALNPVVTLLLAAWLFRERVNRTIGLGMVLAALGAAFVITHGAPLHVLDGAVGIGEMLLLGCVASWVAYTLIGRWVLTGVDALATTTVTAAIGAVMLLIASLVVEGPHGFVAAFDGPRQAWGALVFLVLGATVLAYAWYFDGIKALGAGAAAGYITLVPVFGVFFSALWLGESIDRSTAVGGAMAVAGMALMNYGRKERPRQPPPGIQSGAQA
jgi:drug/metabolite transporter (DMT)-like permease